MVMHGTLRFWPLLRILTRAKRRGLGAEIRAFAKLALRVGRQPPVLFQMATGYWTSQAIYVAAKLGIADVLKDGPKSCPEISAAVGADIQGLRRLLRALSGIGVVAAVQEDRFVLMPLGEALQTDIPGSFRAMIMTLGDIHYRAWGGLLHSVKSGKPAFDDVFGTGLFQYLGKNFGAGIVFNQAMAEVSTMACYAVLLAYDFSEISTIVDVGGGYGKFVQTLLRMNPWMTGIVLDTVTAIEAAKKNPEADLCAGRCSFVAGDFFESVPAGADAYLLSGVIHDWGDAASITVLKNCRRAMGKDAKLLLLETVISSSDASRCRGHFSELLDLNMLVMTGGRERTSEEYRVLLQAAGFELTRVAPTVGPFSLIQGTPK